MLRALLDAGNTGFIDDNDTVLAGTPARPGPVIAGTPVEWLHLFGWGCVGGERCLVILRRRGRHVARHGTLAGYDDTITDVDLAAWGRGEVDYHTEELLEAIDARFARVATSRREVLDILFEEGVTTVADARRDV